MQKCTPEYSTNIQAIQIPAESVQKRILIQRLPRPEWKWFTFNRIWNSECHQGERIWKSCRYIISNFIPKIGHVLFFHESFVFRRSLAIISLIWHWVEFIISKHIIKISYWYRLVYRWLDGCFPCISNCIWMVYLIKDNSFRKNQLETP